MCEWNLANQTYEYFIKFLSPQKFRMRLFSPKSRLIHLSKSMDVSSFKIGNLIFHLILKNPVYLYTCLYVRNAFLYTYACLLAGYEEPRTLPSTKRFCFAKFWWIFFFYF